MSFFLVGDEFHGHRKVRRLLRSPQGLTALGLWTLAGSWCKAHPTSCGVVPREIVEDQGAPSGGKVGVARALKAAAALVACGLWEEHPEGWVFHDWEFNGNNEGRLDIEARRAYERERKQVWRASRLAGDGPGDVRDTSGTVPSRGRAPAGTPPPSRAGAPADPIRSVPIQAVAVTGPNGTTTPSAPEVDSDLNVSGLLHALDLLRGDVRRDTGFDLPPLSPKDHKGLGQAVREHGWDLVAEVALWRAHEVAAGRCPVELWVTLFRGFSGALKAYRGDSSGGLEAQGYRRVE